MKRNLVALFAAGAIAVCALFGGCSCTGNATLSFSPMNHDNETLEYTVKYSDDYNDATKKDASIDSLFAFEYSEGKYLSEVKKAATSDEAIKNSDILAIKDSNGDTLVDTVYLMTTEFTVDLKLVIGETEYNHTERITTTSYFAGTGKSLAPLYAKEDAEYTIISTGVESVQAYIVKSVSETYYDKAEYRTVKTAKTFNADEPAENITLDGATAEETKGEYAFRSAIDNAELLYAIRVSKAEENSPDSLSVISPAYNEPMPISVSATAASEKTLNINYNGEDVSATFQYKPLSFALNRTNAKGTSQYASVQISDAGTVKNHALLIEYVKPLTTYGNYLKMGALVFTLSSATIY